MAMERSLLRQWAQIPVQANAVLQQRRAAGLLGLGQGDDQEAVLRSKQQELASIRSERKAIEAETARIRARLRGEPVREAPPPPAPSFLDRINWTYALIGAGVVGALIWRGRKR
jgi:hypothetical protein